MKKLILLLVFPLLGMPAFAQQKKKPAGKKAEPVRTETVQENIVEPPPPERVEPVESNRPGAGTAETRPSFAGKIFTSVEQMPEFPGGINTMRHFLAEHIQYPETARKKGIQGSVYLQFVVTETGQIKNVEIKRDIGEGCAQEAVRVVNSMPLWKPGMQGGHPVSVYYTLPVAFRLDGGIPAEKKEQK